MTTIRIGTRGSLLALAQTTMVADTLHAAGYGPTVRHVVDTTGDRKQGTPGAATLDKREWVDALERALVRGDIDVAIHSGKDMPAEVIGGTTLLPVLHREDPRDVFIGRALDPSREERLLFADLPAGAVLGTSSARRATQVVRVGAARGLEVHTVDWRGNVPTRVRKLDEARTTAGIVVAAAGVERLQRTSLHALRLDEVVGLSTEREAAAMRQLAACDTLNLSQAHRFAPDELVPAMNQGILAAQVRVDRDDVRAALTKLASPELAAVFWAERTCVALLGADCYSALGVLAEPIDNGARLRLRARVLVPGEPGRCVEHTAEGDAGEPYALGAVVADTLNAAGAQALLSAARPGR